MRKLAPLQSFRRQVKFATLLACALITLLALLSVWRDFRLAKGPVIRNSANVTMVVAEHLSNVFQAVHQLDERLSAERDVRGLLRSLPRLRAFLNDNMVPISGLGFVFVLDPQARLIASTEPLLPVGAKFNLPDLERMKSLEHQGMWIGNIDRSLGEDRAFVPFVRIIADAQGKNIGLLGGALDTRFYDHFFSDLRIWGHDAIFVLSRDGTLLLRYPEVRQALGQNFRDLSLVFQELRKRESGWFYGVSPVDGLLKLSYFRQVPGAPIIAVAGRSQPSVYATWRVSSFIHVIFMLVGVGSILFLSHLLLRQVARLEADQRHRRAYEKQVRQIQKMESIGRFAGGIAHDFNNILTILFGHIDRLEHTLPADHEITPVREKLFQGTLRARDLVRQILALSRKDREQSLGQNETSPGGEKRPAEAAPLPMTFSANHGILFVDDEETVVELVREALQAQGLTCFCTSDPLGALEEFRRRPDFYRLLVTDINMAPMDGFELLRKIHEIKPDLPVLFATAFTEHRTQIQNHIAVQKGLGRFLPKPYKLKELTDLIDSMIYP
ncbi:MAG: response regulator [Bdellovibrionaceae bacterium]|nr:response regulator [Pseudobdellovibrionaceae bacterium]MBX3035031.1 response regulator [Pseudobdellovibrionaceae bacterium]